MLNRKQFHEPHHTYKTYHSAMLFARNEWTSGDRFLSETHHSTVKQEKDNKFFHAAFCQTTLMSDTDAVTHSERQKDSMRITNPAFFFAPDR